MLFSRRQISIDDGQGGEWRLFYEFDDHVYPICFEHEGIRDHRPPQAVEDRLLTLAYQDERERQQTGEVDGDGL